MAAARNNLEKARAAPKDKIYRQTEKRLAANRANLARAKALRQQKLEQIVDRLDQAFPPVGERVENCPENQAADWGALEKLGRAILHRRRTLFSEVRREGRQVMRLLTQATERTVHPALQDILSLAYNLMTVLVNSRLLGRAERLNKRIENLMVTFVEKRYGDQMGIAVSRMAELEGMQAHIQQALPPRPKRRPRARPKPKSGEEACAGTQAPSQRPCGPVPHAASGAGVGSNLPETLGEFQGLVRRAFYAPSPDPVDDATRRMLDDLARSLWNRLHLFEKGLQREAERLDQVLDQMGDTLPENEHDLRDRCCRTAVVLKEAAAAEPMLSTYTQDLRLRLGTLMSQRYGLDPEIDRFLRSQ